MKPFKAEGFGLEKGDYALFIDNRGVASPKPKREFRPLFVRCMEKLEELASTKSSILFLEGAHARKVTFAVLGAYLSPWQKFTSADVYHDPAISLPNIEVISPLCAEPIRYKADRVAVGLRDIREAFKHSKELEAYRPYADLIELQLPKNVRSGLITDLFSV